jgi:hypothetical protein
MIRNYRVSFNFDVDFECQAMDLKDAVIDWWSECTDVPDYTIIAEWVEGEE